MTTTTTTTRSLETALIEDTADWVSTILGAHNINGAYSFDTKAGFYNNIGNIPLNDIDAAEWVKRTLGNKYTYLNTSKSGGDWYYWDGTVHVLDEIGNADDTIAKEFAKAILKVLNHIMSAVRMTDNITQEDKAIIMASLAGRGGHMTYVKGLHSESGLSKLRSRIRTELSKAKDYFDNDTEYIVLADGTVLQTRDLTLPPLAPDASRPVTNKMGVALGGVDRKPGLWSDFLNRLGLAADDQKYLQLMAGAALLGRADAKNIAALVGISNTGKTSYAMSIFKVFGGYAGNLPAGAIVDKGSVNFDQYKARGKRFILLEEPYEKRTDDSFLKNFSGAGGKVSTQEKGKNGVDWKPQGVLHITANHVPKIDTKDDAIVKRMNIVGFNVKGKKIIDDIEEGPKLDEPADIHMRDSSNAIFEWIMEGAMEYNATRVVIESESIKRAARTNVANGSVVIRWLLEQCEWSEDGKTPPRWDLHATTIHTAMVPSNKEEFLNFSMWCGLSNEKAVSKSIWMSEINKFMGEPEERSGKRSGGQLRLWGVSKKDNTLVQSVMDSSSSSQIARMGSIASEFARS